MPTNKQTTATVKSGAQMHGDDPEARKRAAAVLGGARTEAKARAARENGAKNPGGRAPMPLSSFPCTCGRGDSLDGHPTTCPRGVTIWRRRRKGIPLT